MLRVALTGFLAGTFGGIIVAIQAFIGLIVGGAFRGRVLGGLLGGLTGVAVGFIMIIFAAFRALFLTIDGFIGGLLTELEAARFLFVQEDL